MYEQVLADREVKKLFPQFSKFQDFYLAGGTALALQIGHRISIDLDFFSKKELPPNLLQQVKRNFLNSVIEVIYKETKEQLTFLLNGFKITFLHYPYPVIEGFVKYQSVPIATVKEIAAMKAFSIGKRLSYKDYIDWYFLLKEKYVDLKEVIELAERKFNGDFNDRLFLSQLVSISDVPTLPIDFLRGKVNRKTVEKFLTTAVRNFGF